MLLLNNCVAFLYPYDPSESGIFKFKIVFIFLQMKFGLFIFFFLFPGHRQGKSINNKNIRGDPKKIWSIQNPLEI